MPVGEGDEGASVDSLDRAATLSAQGRYEEAVRAYELALEFAADPDAAPGRLTDQAFAGRALAFERLKDLRQAISRHLQSGAATNDSISPELMSAATINPSLWLWRGIAEHACGRRAAASQAIRRFVELATPLEEHYRAELLEAHRLLQQPGA